MSNSNQKHRWYDVIVAWAEGKEIQVKRAGNIADNWTDFNSSNPCFDDDWWQWRIKPKTITKHYRMALFSNNIVATVDVTNSCIDGSAEFNSPGFIRWLGEPVEVELEVNDE